MHRISRVAFVPLIGLFALVAMAVPPDAAKDKKKAVPEAEEAAGRATVEGGLKAEVWASEPHVANPVSFAFDEKGKCYIAETFRHTDGVTDTRSHMYWLDDDIACRTVADRVAMYKKHKYGDYTKFGEQLRVVWDSTGSGRVDKSEIFAGPYNRPEDGLAAGVLARKGNVYLACIPDLYLLKDTTGANKADVKQSLATGFGIHVQFIGHDLHGLRMGPDGKLYMSIGDRGLNITNKEGKKLFYPDTGCVLRCEPDGANLEVVHSGLRNPQELAFDDFGNLFTYDNNSDSGDQARWVHIVEGGDSGWRCGYQYGTLMHTPAVPQGNRGPWNTEQIWHVPGPNSQPPAYVVPALKNFGNGPSGITAYPGVGLSERYKNHFFACDFTANPGGSKIWSLALKPKGASYEVVDLHPFVQNMVPTDCEFGPDGAFYWLDWTTGWNKPAKGRIFRAADPTAMKNSAIPEAQKLLADGLEKKTVEELSQLLGHVHRNVRFEAQYELATRAKTDHKTVAFAMASAASNKKADTLRRLHAIWALGQIEGGGKHSTLLQQSAKGLLKDVDVEIRSQTAKILGSYFGAWGTLRTALSAETDLRVKAQMVGSLGKLKPEDSAETLNANTKASTLRARVLPALEILQENNDADAYLRHAAVMSLVAATTNANELVEIMRKDKGFDDSPAVRLGVVLALRRMKSAALAGFTTDADAKVAAEVARAIHDENLMEAMPALAVLSDKSNQPDVVSMRALSANFKLGTKADAERAAKFAARSNEAAYVRVVALKLLSEWSKPSRRDPITGLTMNLPERPATIASEALKPVVAGIFNGNDAVRKEAVQVVSKLDMKEVGALMATIVTDAKQPAAMRVESLFALESLKAKELTETVKIALASTEPKLRAAGRVVTAKANPEAAGRELPLLLKDKTATVIEKQMAFGVLGGLKESKEVDAALDAWMDQLIVGTVPAELKLDVLDAASVRSTIKDLKLHAPLREKVATYDKQVRAKAGMNLTIRNSEALAGGDADRGRNLFLNNSAVYCQRCHKLDGQGGEVGPVMNGIAKDKTREYMLESIVNPNGQIAQGYQSVILNLLDGKTVSGVLRSKDKKTYVLVTPENKVLSILAEDVESEKPDKSAMPEDLYKKLSKRELRDIVEFLMSMKEPLKQ